MSRPQDTYARAVTDKEVVSAFRLTKPDPEGHVVYKVMLSSTDAWGHTWEQGSGLPPNARDAVHAALSFLAADAERYAAHRDDGDEGLFPDNVAEWAYQNDDELAMAQLEMDEEED